VNGLFPEISVEQPTAACVILKKLLHGPHRVNADNLAAAHCSNGSCREVFIGARIGPFGLDLDDVHGMYVWAHMTLLLKRSEENIGRQPSTQTILYNKGPCEAIDGNSYICQYANGPTRNHRQQQLHISMGPNEAIGSTC